MTSRAPCRTALLPAALAALAITGCSFPGRVVDRLPPDSVSRGFRVLPRPVVLPRSRLTSDCGPEAVCAVMTYWGKAASVREISLMLRQPGIQGSFSTQIGPLARQKGFKSTCLEGSVGRIKNAVDREVPPIVMVDAGGGEFHYFVVTGYSDAERVVVCEEYQDLKRLLSYDDLEERWRPAGHLMVEIERSTAEDDFRAGAGLESRGRHAEAAPFFRRALAAEPEHYEARVGLANCLLAAGKPQEALEEYRRALAANPSDPKVMNNLANVLLELKREPAEAERLAEAAAAGFEATFRAAKDEAAKVTHPAIREIRHRELRPLELDLAFALGTLGQARAAGGKDALAVAAWKASYDHLPLTMFDVRARRQVEIAGACKRMQMPAEARKHLEQGLAEARDPALRARIEAELK